MNKAGYRIFTLIEVLVALFIFATAITATMYAMSASARRMRFAREARMESQRMANAIEFYLLYPPGVSIEQKFFPYEDMGVDCRYEEPELPDEMEKEIGTQRLVTMIVELKNNAGQTISELSVDRIIEAEQQP